MIDFEKNFPVDEDSIEQREKYLVYLKNELEKVYEEKWQITYFGSSCVIRCKSVKDRNIEFTIRALFQKCQTEPDYHIEVYKCVSFDWFNKKRLSGGGTWRDFSDMNELCEERLTKKKQEQLSLW